MTAATVTLPTPASGMTLRLEIGSNAWTTVTLVGQTERSLGAETAYDVLSRLMAALSDQAQPTRTLGIVEGSPVLTLWEDHHTIWVQRRGGGEVAIHIQQDAPGADLAESFVLDSSERDAWRAALVEVMVQAHADGTLF